jgi:Zn-dependent M28 family amino/carboxypeptidase
MRPSVVALHSALLALVACAPRHSTGAQGTSARADSSRASPRVDSSRLLGDVRVLSADSLQGRATGTAGGEKARRYVAAAFQRARLQPFGSSYAQPFEFAGPDGSRRRGTNVVGYTRGTADSGRFIVVSAHYDHLGVRDGQVYNGADDNASGTATLIALAEYFTAHRPRHSIIFVAFDGEEVGLQGARAFVANPPVSKGALAVNVNMDMVSHSDAGELYVAGTQHYPSFTPVVDRVAARAPVKLLRGHDQPGLPPGEDWTSSSDHGPFHAAGIPFVYFGVEDHKDYHRPTDDFGTITPAFFAKAAETIVDVVDELDRNLPINPVAPPAN